MHHLFFNLPTESLLKEPFTTQHKDPIHIAASDIGLKLPDATCYAPPIIESFVGSDALGVILGFGLTFDDPPSMILDIGTNSEIIVMNNNKIWVASAASGPAFEGMSLACGSKAIEGAINQVHFDSGTKSFVTQVIGKTYVKGISGVGAISALSSLRDAGLLSSEGSINRDADSDLIFHRGSVYGVIIDKSSEGQVFLGQIDIRMLQQSKAAIRTVIELLLQESKSAPSEVENLYVTGAFGNGLDIQAATNIDMIPQLPGVTNIIQEYGGALSGAELLLISKHARSKLNEIYRSIKYVDMMNHPLYSELHSKFSFFP
jgi:uncharacterized 2Fe-2S/4Fe-4S cluster protein (DUF4445 family)